MLDHKDILPHYYQERLKPCFDLQEGFQMNPEERMNDIHSYYEQQILKYLYRYPFKNGVDDLEKARTYLNKLIDSYYISNYPHDLPDEYEDGDISGEALNDV